MTYPLEEPNGWFLATCGHRHELEGRHYIPMQLSQGNWFVTFQKTVDLQSVSAPGHTLEEAWSKATKMAEVASG